MTDNHHHDWSERVERLLQDGQSAGDPLLDDLAGTIPQARPEFQQALEDELVLSLQEHQGEIMPMRINNDRDQKPKRVSRGLPVTLAATVAMILFGGLAALIATGPLANAPIFSGAAQDDIPSDMAATATALIAQATYQAAEAQFLTANAQLRALEQQATEGAGGDLFLTPVDPLAQTATALVQRATQEAAIIWTATALVEIESGQAEFVPSPTSTPIGSADCSPQKLVVYTAPGTHNPVLTSIDPLTAEKYQIQGILTLHETGEDWFYITFVYEDGPAQGWVQAEVIRAACEHLTSSAIAPDAQVTMLPPTVVPPESDSMFTATPFPPTVMPPVYTATPTAWDAPPMYTSTPLLTATASPVGAQPAGPFTPTVMPFPALSSIYTVQVRVADPETLDREALAGQQVDVFMVVVMGRNSTTVPVARGVTVQAVVEVPQTDGTVVIEAILIPRTAEQAETLQALAQTQMELTLVPVE